MNTGLKLYANNLVTAGLTVLLFGLAAGCEDNPMSPHHHHTSGFDDGRYVEVIDRSFSVTAAPVVIIEGFVGNVTFRTGESGTVRVVATQRAGRRSNLDGIELSMVADNQGLHVRAANPLNFKNVSVDLEIFAPSDAIPRISTGVGIIDYKGRPTGSCRFGTGVGSIRLRLRADSNITVELRAGVGSIHMDFPVYGVAAHLTSVVTGKIGTGDEGHVRADTGVGTIYVTRW
jgi:hypothetical protein